MTTPPASRWTTPISGTVAASSVASLRVSRRSVSWAIRSTAARPGWAGRRTAPPCWAAAWSGRGRRTVGIRRRRADPGSERPLRTMGANLSPLFVVARPFAPRHCYSRESGDPGPPFTCRVPWVPAFAGMTNSGDDEEGTAYGGLAQREAGARPVRLTSRRCAPAAHRSPATLSPRHRRP